MKLLDDALERIKPYIVESLERMNPNDYNFNYNGEENYNYFSATKPTNATIARLRLDWELADPLGQEESKERIADLMIAQMENDLLDLLVNGDVNNISDPLLKTIDGSKKRGVEPVMVDIFAAHLFWEWKRKETTEYTLYILMAVQWEE